MFSAGTDTSSIVLEFAMAELMRKPHLMAKLQADVRSKTPKSQQTVKEEDRSCRGDLVFFSYTIILLLAHPGGVVFSCH